MKIKKRKEKKRIIKSLYFCFIQLALQQIDRTWYLRTCYLCVAIAVGAGQPPLFYDDTRETRDFWNDPSSFLPTTSATSKDFFSSPMLAQPPTGMYL